VFSNQAVFKSHWKSHFMFHAEFSVVFAAAACCWYLLSARAAAASLL
jgi:hypothetical protein